MRYLSTSALAGVAVLAACSGSSTTGFQNPTDGGTGAGDTGGGTGTGQGSGLGGGNDGGSLGTGPGGSTDAATVTVTTIYADTDTDLYTLDPKTNQVTLVGAFSGFGGASGDDGATDCAVNAEGDVYINSESVIYKATLPAGGAGSVELTQIAKIALQSNSFYALAFAPPGVLGAGETLVGGDNNGELWAIDPTTGATKDLGNFGPNPSESGDILGCSGDIVFYLNTANQPTGLATIRSCKSDGSDCNSKDDFLAGIDMAALLAAYTSGTPATSLLAGVYGGGSGTVGAGTGFGELFGLGAWEGTVFGFGHDTGDLVTISSGGVGTLVSSMSSTEWAGAGVTTKATITVTAPPPK